MIPNNLPKELINRLKTRQGQVFRNIKMLINNNNPDIILKQFKTIENALQKTHFILLDEVLRKTLTTTIVETIEICPGNCYPEYKIYFLLKQFPYLKFNQIPQKLNEIYINEERIKKLINEMKLN